MQLTIDPEFHALCPPLKPEERNLLEAGIERDGCSNPIVVWANHDDTIIDGHNRYEICTALGRTFKTRAMVFQDRAAVIEWIITNQLGRRNLTDEQKSYLRGKRYQSEKKAHGERGDAKKTGQNEQSFSGTAERLAAEFNVGESTIRRDEKFAEAVDVIASAKPGMRNEILSGKSRFTKQALVCIAELPPEQQASAVESEMNPPAVPKWSPKTSESTSPDEDKDEIWDLISELYTLTKSASLVVPYREIKQVAAKLKDEYQSQRRNAKRRAS